MYVFGRPSHSCLLFYAWWHRFSESEHVNMLLSKATQLLSKATPLREKIAVYDAAITPKQICFVHEANNLTGDTVVFRHLSLAVQQHNQDPLTKSRVRNTKFARTRQLRGLVFLVMRGCWLLVQKCKVAVRSCFDSPTLQVKENGTARTSTETEEVGSPGPHPRTITAPS